MNEFLADLYGTRESIGSGNASDVEKLAEAQVLDQVFKSEGIDVDTLPDEAIVKVAHELFGDNSAIVKAAQDEPAAEGETAEEEAEEEEEEEEEKSDEEKTAEDLQKADFYGRVMAHSFTQERNIIEKTGGKASLLKRLGRSASGAAESASKSGRKLLKKVKKTGKSVGKELTSNPVSTFREGRALRMGAGGKGGLKETLKDVGQTIGAHKLQAGLAGGALAAGAGAAALHKKGSALDVLAEKRAMEILEANGVQFEATEEEKLAEAVEARAVEILAENGYTVE